MIVLVIHAKSGDELKTIIDALGVITVISLTKLHSKPEYLLIYS